MFIQGIRFENNITILTCLQVLKLNILQNLVHQLQHYLSVIYCQILLQILYQIFTRLTQYIF